MPTLNLNLNLAQTNYAITVAQVALDPPISSSESSVTLFAFGFDQLVEGYTGTTVRLKRLDNTEQDFGVDAYGKLNTAAIDNFRTESDFTLQVVKFYDQKGSAKTLDAVGTSYMPMGRPFGLLWDESDASLYSDGVRGASGCYILGGAYFQLSNSGIAGSNGLEVHMAAESYNRKRPSNITDTVGSATATAECYFSLGEGTANFWRYDVSGGAYTHSLRRYTGVGNDTNTTGGNRIIKEKGLHIFSAAMDGTTNRVYAIGTKELTSSLTADNITKNNAMTNPTFRVARRYAGTTGEATTYAEILFSGAIITQTLTDLQRYKVLAKLGQVIQQDLTKTKAQVESLFDEIIYMKDVDVNTGLVNGAKGKTAIQFNYNTSYGGKAPDWNFNYTIPDIGIRGIYCPDDKNDANIFAATNNYFAGTTEGTVVVVGFADTKPKNTPTDDAAYTTNLYSWFEQADLENDGTAYAVAGTRSKNQAFSLMFDHSCAKIETKCAASRDTNAKTGITLFPPANTGFDGANRDPGKYTTGTTHVKFTYDETIQSIVYDEDTWLTNVGITRCTPENATFNKKLGFLLAHVATFKNPETYDRADDQATRELTMRNATVHSYNTPAFGIQKGGMDGAIAYRLDTANVVDSTDNARIRSGARLGHLKGTRVLFAFAKRVLTPLEIDTFLVNLYKLIT